MTKTLNSRIPEGPVAEKWTNYKAHQRLVNPKNKLKLDVIVVGTGLAGASAAATLGEMGFNVINLCIQDSPRRAPQDLQAKFLNQFSQLYAIKALHWRCPLAVLLVIVYHSPLLLCNTLWKKGIF